MRRSFFAYGYNKGEQIWVNTVSPYYLYYANVGDGALDVPHTMNDKPAK